MKSNLYLLVFAALTLCITSCKKEVKEQTRMERVMAVHDELMPKMSTIGKLSSALEPKIDTTAAGATYKIAKDSLVHAYDFMMEWMKDFGDKFDSEEILEGKALTPEKEALLLEQEEKVQQMKDMMLGSIANAEALLAKEN